MLVILPIGLAVGRSAKARYSPCPVDYPPSPQHCRVQRGLVPPVLPILILVLGPNDR